MPTLLLLYQYPGGETPPGFFCPKNQTLLSEYVQNSRHKIDCFDQLLVKCPDIWTVVLIFENLFAEYRLILRVYFLARYLLHIILPLEPSSTGFTSKGARGDTTYLQNNLAFNLHL